MSSTYTPTPTLLTDITVPADGDAETAASVNVAFEAIADGVAHNSEPETDATKVPLLASRDLNIAQHGQVWYDPAEWGQVTAKPSAVQLNGTATYISIDLQMPHGSTCKEVYVYVTGGGAHVGLPATMPSWVLYVRDLSTGADTSLDSKADTSANVAAYEVYHFIGHHVTVPFVVDRAKRYWLVMNGEGSTNALAGLKFEGVGTVCTVTSQDIGAS